MLNYEIENNKSLLTLFYFNLKNSHIDNNKEKINFYLKALYKTISILGEEESNKTLKDYQKRDLKNIIESIKNKDFYNPISYPIEDNNDNLFIKNDPRNFLDNEKDLEKRICQTINFEKINKVLNTNMRLIDNQVQTNYGKVDILAQDDRTLYIIELKKDIADHKIIGQLIKYSNHFQKRLIYNLYDHVKVITIAGDYNEFTYRELKKMNIDILIYSYVNNEINLKKA